MKLWDKKTFQYATLSAVLWSLIHLYAFSRLMVSHDSLAEFYAGAELSNGYTGIRWKIALGRFVVPVYQKLFRGTVAAPWLIGLLSILFLALSVYVVVRIFDIQRKLPIFLTAAILVCNPAIFMTAATFIHDLDADMLALLLSTMSVWCWKENKPIFWIIGALCVSLCMGIYASYLSVAIVLVIFVSILRLLQCEQALDVMIQGLKAIAMILAGLGLYALMTYAVCRVTGVALIEGDYNSITGVLSQSTRNELLPRIAEGYKSVAKSLYYTLFGHGNSINAASVIAVVGGLFLLINRTIRGKMSSAVLTFFLIALLPVAMDLSMIAGSGYVHDLMRCAFMLAYLLVLLLAEPVLYAARRIKKVGAALLVLCIGMVCWQYAVQANQIYLKKDFENRFTTSLMTRIMTQVEQREDYVQGETTLLFAGNLNDQIKERGELIQYWNYTGVGSNTPIQSWKLYEPYLEYMMGIEVVYCDGEKRWELVTSQEVKDMPVYPQEGSIRMIDDVLVIKVGTAE